MEVDENCRTSLADVFAIGDCAAFVCSFCDGTVMRVESVQNANDQATCAAITIAGSAVPYHALPWFWSNQYDLRLQTVGLSLGYDRVVVRGDLASRSFSIIYLKAGRIVALDCVNSVKDYVQGRKLVEAGICPGKWDMADCSVPPKELTSSMLALRDGTGLPDLESSRKLMSPSAIRLVLAPPFSLHGRIHFHVEMGLNLAE